MRKMATILFLMLLLGVITTTIHANTNREVTIITVPEGTVTQIKEVVSTDHPGSNEFPNQDAERVVQIETIEVPEGIVTVKTEVIGTNLQSDIHQEGENLPAVSPEQLQQIHDTLMRLIEESQALHDDGER